LAGLGISTQTSTRASIQPKSKFGLLPARNDVTLRQTSIDWSRVLGHGQVSDVY